MLDVQLMIIDFGFSEKGKSNLRMDIVQLVRTMKYFDKLSPQAEEFVLKPLIEILRTSYGIKDFSEKNLDDIYLNGK